MKHVVLKTQSKTDSQMDGEGRAVFTPGTAASRRLADGGGAGGVVADELPGEDALAGSSRAIRAVPRGDPALFSHPGLYIITCDSWAAATESYHFHVCNKLKSV